MREPKEPYEGDIPDAVMFAVEEAARDGRVTCARLRKIAEDQGVGYRVAGAAADHLDVRVRDCDLGCF